MKRLLRQRDYKDINIFEQRELGRNIGNISHKYIAGISLNIIKRALGEFVAVF